MSTAADMMRGHEYLRKRCSVTFRRYTANRIPPSSCWAICCTKSAAPRGLAVTSISRF